MHPDKVTRDQVKTLTDLPNIGKAGAADLRLLGYQTPADLAGAAPFAMYERLCAITGATHAPCVLDVFISVTRFMAGDEPQAWWQYTEQRKRMLDEPRSAAGNRSTKTSGGRSA